MLAEWTRTRRRTVWVVALLLAHIEDGTSQPEPAGVFPELPRLFGGESCPPRPSLRPADCRRVDTTINRVLYDQLEAVHAIAIDAFETSTTLWTDLAQILQFLNGLREFLCHARYGYCHFPNTEVLFNHMEVACQELNAACEAMPYCSEALAGGDLCKDSVNTEAQNGRLFGRVLDGLAVFVARLAMKSDLEEGTWADLPHLASVLAAGSLARRGVGFRDQGDICSEQLAPRRIQGLDGKIYDVGGGLKARLLTPWRAIGLLTELDDLGPSLLRHVVNLGAGEMDAANCVLERARGFSGILLEVDEKRAKDLRKRFRNRPDVQVVTRVLEPREFPQAVLDAAWNLERELPAPGSRYPAFLKIDVDNGDCDYLSAWLATGYKPVIIQMEIVHSYIPPDIGLAIPFERRISSEGVDEQYNFAHSMMSVGCSLGAVLSLLGGEYSLLSWSFFKPVDAEFVLTSWARERNLLSEVVEPERIPEFWRKAVSRREAWTRDFYHGLELDPHIMVDDLLSNDEQQLEIQRAQELLRERIDASQHAEG